MKLSTLLLTPLLTAAALTALAADQPLDIDREIDILGFVKPIPVQVTGFSSEAAAILKFDLLFMGFEFTSQDKARYLIQGKNSPGRIEGIVYDPIAKQTKLAKAFTGANLRAQVHALADDIAQTLTGKPGIAQTKIAFVAKPSGVGVGEIHVADFDGYNLNAVTQDRVIVAAPAWAGRGTLFYTSYKFGKPDIFSQSLASGARRAVARFNGMNSSAAISPDGRRLAMILSKSGNPQVHVGNLDGSNLRQLTSGKGVNACPCWAPDNRTLCFVSDRGGSPGLYTMPADGGTPARMPTIGVGRPTEPDWSPDGKYIVFTSQYRGGFNICLVATSGPKRGDAVVLADGQDPAWAPNSRAVVFARSVGSGHVLSLLDVPTKQVKDIARISGSEQPSWAR